MGATMTGGLCGGMRPMVGTGLMAGSGFLQVMGGAGAGGGTSDEAKAKRWACRECHKAKTACEGNPCRRCQRLGKACISQEQPRGRCRRFDDADGPSTPPAPQSLSEVDSVATLTEQQLGDSQTAASSAGQHD